MITGDQEGLSKGAFYGGLAEGGGEALYGGARLVSQEVAFETAYSGSKYTWSSAVKKHIRHAKGFENPANAATRFNPRLDGDEYRELSHWIPQRNVPDNASAEDLSMFQSLMARETPLPGINAKLGNFLGNRPSNIRGMWAIDHAKVDEFRHVAADVEMLPESVRWWRRAPEPIQHMGIGGLNVGKNLATSGSEGNDDPKE
jgi:hypothetical protein